MQKAHRKLIERIDAAMAQVAFATGRRRLAPRVRRALERVKRELFVRPADQASAYLNRPLSIGHRQTISQPFIVALMTELLDLEPQDVVLEVGTGCGYQTAVLAELVATVHSVEVIPALAEDARERLAALGYDNVHVHVGDGRAGWPAGAPYDGIMVTAAAAAPPPALVEQLAPCGRLVLPLGEPRGDQMLVVLDKDADGKLARDAVLPVAFVPLVYGS